MKKNALWAGARTAVTLSNETLTGSTFGPRRIGRFCAAASFSVARAQLSSGMYGNKLLSRSGRTVDIIHAVLQKQWHPQ